MISHIPNKMEIFLLTQVTIRVLFEESKRWQHTLWLCIAPRHSIILFPSFLALIWSVTTKMAHFRGNSAVHTVKKLHCGTNTE